MKDKDTVLLEEAYSQIKPVDLDGYDIQRMIGKISQLPTDQKIKLIYQWTKEGRLTLKAFAYIVKDKL
jgi:hypothetical protein